MKNLLSIIFALLCYGIASSQELTQTVRGTVTDKISQTPIPGAIVTLVGLEPKKAMSTNDNGEFKFTEVPVGKRSVLIHMTGYQDVLLSNLVLNSGKELVLNVSMEESIVAMDEVVINASVEKSKPLNEMSTVSSRTFSVEEAQKYAAAVNDPARMATAYAGVIQMYDGNNHISIRGNSPFGLLWRMEGVDIPNPNHFSSVGTAGGGISILSAQLLTNSDFTTGAFASEYGNALSGVFDLKLRKGNNEKREFTFQAGVLGIDVSSEGPFKKGYGGSYLFNYRYSTLGVLSKMGVDIGDGVTTFQDLAFNVFLPTKSVGNFTLFGFGGLSSQVTKALEDTTQWTDDFYKSNSDFRANTGATGITHTKLLGEKAYIKSALVLSGTENSYYEEELDYSFVPHETYSESYIQHKLTFSSMLSQKISNRHSLRSGIIVNRIGYSLVRNELEENLNSLQEKMNDDGSSYSAQAYAQWQYRANEKLTLNTGAHYLHFFLNNSFSVEPRAAIRYSLTPVQSISLGYGLHSQIQPLIVYFSKVQGNDGTLEAANKNLKLSKAHHCVLAYDYSLNEYWRVKTEVYYQSLFSIAQGTIPSENYSLINQLDGYSDRALTSNGTGRNYGVELTVERFMHRNFYLLGSASAYQSEYKGTDGNYYNTRFNGNYAFSFTAGKEIEWSGKIKKRALGFNVKSTYAGGFRQTPIDMDATLATGQVVVENNKAFSEKMPAYFRTDVRISYKTNFKRMTGTVALDIQNVTNRKNVGGRYFDDIEKVLKYWYQAPLIPILSYRLEF